MIFISISISIVKADKNETFLNINFTDSYPEDLTNDVNAGNATELVNDSLVCEESSSKGMDSCDRNDSISNLSKHLEGLISSEIQDHQVQLRDYIDRIFCSIRTIFLYIYVDINVSGAWADGIVRDLSECSSDGVIVVR